VDFATENLSPEAVIKFTKHQDDPFTFSFDGSDSTDPDDDIETWEWNFGDGQSATGATPPPHTFADGTERTITLRVTDKTGLRDSTEIKIRPGKFKVSGQFYERVCGRPSTLAPFQAPELVHVKADSPDGFLEMRPDADGYEFESTPGDFTVFPTEVLVRQRATPPFPEWDPAVRFFPLESDVPDQDFELCYAPSAPVQANILSRNGVFKADTLSVRNGGIIRICDEDGISRVISAFGKAGGDDIYSYGTDRYTETTASGCMSIVPVNSAPSVMHLDLLSQSFLGTIFITVVVLPGAPPSGITTLVSPANAGSNRLEVASNSGFVPGDQVLLDPDGTGKATYTMQQNGSIILTQPLKRSYPAGTIVVNLTNPPPGFSLEQPQVNSGGVPGQDPNQFPVLGGTVVPATPAAAATPVSEVSGARSISPPSTGTGGLADDSQGNRWRVVVLVAAMLVPALAVWRRPQRGRRAPPLSQAPPCA
jgi:PKD repeat protein